MSRKERVSSEEMTWDFAIFGGTLMRQARTGDSTQRRTNGTATIQAPGLSTTKSRPAPAARNTPQRRCQ